MAQRTLLAAAFSIFILSGCQSSPKLSHAYQDPERISAYELPVPISDGFILQSYRQTQPEQTWFWSLLPNESSQQGENIIVQIVAEEPIQQPPSRFGFVTPDSNSQKSLNALGPLEVWRSSKAKNEICTITSQYQRRQEQWISLFTHVCSDISAQPTPTWLAPSSQPTLSWGQ
ncbi:hypothetical protein HGP28_08870 [Vibrio sp. SM6]|uniref:Lipoprotein n=1 Tax=Vibrio agarilyticus TaxID=2726741 RepID=A0A7X8YGI4_9VIBR|nr:hypothetical protein [Vibrio agarilyticus]NLS12998.1 hypothetical protein [Vibrio agarilyticus]